MDITNQHAQNLAAKLNALDLEPEERAVLGELLIHDTDDVEGFASREYLRDLPPVHGFNIGMPRTKEFNIGMPPTKEFNIGMPPTKR